LLGNEKGIEVATQPRTEQKRQELLLMFIVDHDARL